MAILFGKNQHELAIREKFLIRAGPIVQQFAVTQLQQISFYSELTTGLGSNYERGLPYMTSALGGWKGGPQKADIRNKIS